MNERRSKWAALRDRLLSIYCWCLIGVIIYILSIGPLFWYWYDAVYFDGFSGLVVFYYPLSVACEHFQPFEDWVDWYIGVWNS